MCKSSMLGGSKEQITIKYIIPEEGLSKYMNKKRALGYAEIFSASN